jgi:hypothetical protein
VLALYCEDELLALPVPRDEVLIVELVAKALDFWDAIQKRREPDKDPERDVYVPTGPALGVWIEVAEAYRALETRRGAQESELTAIAERQKALQDRLLALMGNFAHGAAAGIKVTRYLQRGNVDYGKLLKEQAPQIGPELMERYRRSSSERVRVDVNGKPVKAEADRKDVGDFFTPDTDAEQRSLYF